jgi:hypothetical protein
LTLFETEKRWGRGSFEKAPEGSITITPSGSETDQDKQGRLHLLGPPVILSLSNAAKRVHMEGYIERSADERL